MGNKRDCRQMTEWCRNPNTFLAYQSATYFGKQTLPERSRKLNINRDHTGIKFWTATVPERSQIMSRFSAGFLHKFPFGQNAKWPFWDPGMFPKTRF